MDQPQNDILHLGKLLTGQDCLLKKDALTTHAAVLSMTGSGKTGLLLGVVEELVGHGVPSILVDIKGDLVNIALQKGELAKKMAVYCLTPGGLHGDSVDVFADLKNPAKLHSSVTALLKMVGEDHDPLKSKSHTYLSEILSKMHQKQAQGIGKPPSLIHLVHKVQDPGFHHLGAMDLDYAFPKRSRTKLAGKLNNLLVAPSFQAWREGVGLSLANLLQPRVDGRVPVVVYSVAHLVNQDEQQFAIQLLLEEILPWMRSLGGSDELRGALFIDECFGLMPPHPKNPPTKTPLLVLLKQARGYGFGVVLASQNPVDLDYKGLSNCQTWLIGRLQMGKDKQRIIQNICSSSSLTERMIESRIGKLQPREFICSRPKGSVVFTTRDVSCTLKGPLTSKDIVDMYHARTLVRLNKAVKPTTGVVVPLKTLSGNKP